MNMRPIPIRQRQQIKVPERNYISQLRCLMSEHLPDEFFWWMSSVNDDFGMIDRRCKRCGAKC